MKLQELKTWVNSLNERQLQQELLYNSEEFSISGVVNSIETAIEDLYYIGEDDPAPLYTKKQLKKYHGMDTEEIAELDIEIPKGSFFIRIGN